jgi:superfamily I DNA/RNA helicase
VPNILVRGISDAALDKLKSAAKRRNRSLQQELKELIEYRALNVGADLMSQAAAIRERLRKKGRKHSDSTRLLMEDRKR